MCSEGGVGARRLPREALALGMSDPQAEHLRRPAGHPTLAAALRHAGGDPTRALAISAWHTDERTLHHFDGARCPD
jgi:hypothetical protein